MSSHDFPSDLYPDVLSRLPTENLLEFRSVSKSWSSIVKDPKFSSMHANRLSDSSSMSQVFLCTSVGEDDRVYNKICEISFSCGVDGVAAVSKVFRSLPLEISNKCPKLVGSSNGVLCLVYEGASSKTSSTVILWNPLSNKYQRLPTLPPYDCFMCCTYGFGYDTVNNDYKVLCFETSTFDGATSAKIYSRKSNTWTSLDMFPISTLDQYNSGVLFEGSLHWVSTRDKSVLAFDLSNEEFKRISPSSMTPCGTLQGGRFYQLVGRGSVKDLRIMLNSNFLIDLRIELTSNDMGWNLIPIAYVKRPREFVIMLKSGELVLYDVEKKSVIDCTNCEVSHINVGDVFPYIQTPELY